MLADNLLAARSQMAFTLGFHILLVPFGLCLPLFALIANARGLRHNDQDALRLARRWSHRPSPCSLSSRASRST